MEIQCSFQWHLLYIHTYTLTEYDTMTGLSSRWATEESLVKKAQLQDKNSGASVSAREVHVFSETSHQEPQPKKPSGLESRWANAPSEEESPKKRSPHKRNNNRSRRKSSFSEKSEQASQPSAHQLPQSSRERKSKHAHYVVENDSNPVDDVETERLQPMTQAAKDFASRLGMLSVDDKPKALKFPKGPSGAGVAGGAHRRNQAPKKHVEIVEYEGDYKDIDEDEPKPPMSAAARSFAARLGGGGNVKQQSSAKTNPQSKPNKPASKYLTPRQKKQQEENQERTWKEKQRSEERKKLDALEEARKEKIKQEVRELFENPSITLGVWADIEDDEF